MAGTTNRVANQGVWIGAGFTSEDSSTAFLPGQLGQVVIQGDKAYQYVQFDSTVVTYANGVPVLWLGDPSTFVVTGDYDAATTNRNKPAGVCLKANTVSNYGWIQVSGPHSAIYTKTSEAAANGDALIYDAADVQCIHIAAGTAPTYVPVAIATATQSANSTAGIVIAPHNGW